MDRGMRFLAALALLWATSTRAASITRVDQACLVQQQLVGAHRGEASTSFDKASLAAAVARTAVNHSHPSMMKDSRKRAVLARTMARLSKLVGSAGQGGAQRHSAQDLQSYLLGGIKREAVVSCLRGPALSWGDWALNLPNAIDSIKSCSGDAGCLIKEILGLIGDVGDNLVDLFNLEQDCGKPFLDELLDCSEGEGEGAAGYLGYTPDEKNLPSFAFRVLTSAALGTAGIWGAVETCKAGEGSLQTPVDPWWLIPTSAASFLLSGYDFWQMARFEGPEGEKAGTFETCETSAGLGSDALGLFTAIMDTVSHVQFGDGSNAKKGFLPLCLGEVASAVNALPDFLGKYCGYRSCTEGFPRAAFREQIYGDGSSDA